MRIVDGSCDYRARRVSIRGTRRGSRNVANVANCSSEPRVAYPEVKVQVRDQVRVVGSRVRLHPGAR